jgi:hypothetical protein
MARKAFIVTDAMREKVRYLAGVGVTQDAIAKIVGCAPKTLRRRCRDELDRGLAEANAQICGYLFAAAKAGNIAAIIFSIKTRLNWCESKAADDPMSGGATGSHANAVLILPDNNRDPELTQVLKDAQQKYFAGNDSDSRHRAERRLSSSPGWKEDPRPSKPSMFRPTTIITRLRQPTMDLGEAWCVSQCHEPRPRRSRHSPDRKPRFCKAQPTSASSAARRGAARRSC